MMMPTLTKIERLVTAASNEIGRDNRKATDFLQTVKNLILLKRREHNNV